MQKKKLKLTLNATLSFSLSIILHKSHLFPKAKPFEIEENESDRKAFVFGNWNFLLEKSHIQPGP